MDDVQFFPIPESIKIESKNEMSSRSLSSGKYGCCFVLNAGTTTVDDKVVAPFGVETPAFVEERGLGRVVVERILLVLLLL